MKTKEQELLSYSMLKAMENYGMKQKQLAKIVGCSQANINYIVQGKVEPKFILYLKIVKALNLKINYDGIGRS